MDKTILIAGSGKLARSLLNGLPSRLPGYQLDTWEHLGRYSGQKPVIVHIGSGRQLPEVIEFCRRNQAPLIQASTGMEHEKAGFDFTFIDAPNLNLLMLKFMFMLKQSGTLFQGYDISLTESHQHSKTSVAGTALEMASSLGLEASAVKSVRNPEDQKNRYGIPDDSLDLHAFHEILIRDGGTSIQFRTLVKGHESYIDGISKIIGCLDRLQPRYYPILELIGMKLI